MWETLCGLAGMAGGARAGESFASRYDPAVSSLLTLGNGVGTFGGISKGLVATARNYAKAEHHSTVAAVEYLAAFADPMVYSSVSYGTPNTAAGGHVGGVNRFLAKFLAPGRSRQGAPSRGGISYGRIQPDRAGQRRAGRGQ